MNDAIAADLQATSNDQMKSSYFNIAIGGSKVLRKQTLWQCAYSA